MRPIDRVTSVPAATATSRPARLLLGSIAAAGALALLAAACVPQQTATVAGEPAPGSARTVALDVESAAVRVSAETPTPTTTPGSYLAGLHAERVGATGDAADFWMYALEQDPENVELLQRAFVLMVNEGRERETVDLARRLVAHMPDASLPKLALVIDDVKHDRLADAEARLRTMPEKGLSKLFAPLLLAWVLAGQGEPDAALEVLAPLADIKGLAILRELHAGLINDFAGRTAAAEENLRSVRDNGQSLSLRVAEALGSLYERMGRPDEAGVLYDRYLAENPEMVLLDEATARLESGEPAAAIVQTTAEGMAEALFNLATILHQQAAILQQQNVGRSTLAALSYARMALALRPNLSVCQALVAEILDGLGHGEAAVAMYESIEKGSPFYWLARMRVAISLDAEGETDEAVARLAAMAEERPERSDALVTMGDIYRAKERFAEAVDAYTRAVERIDTLEERHWSLLYARGISLERSGEWQRAETDFLRALELRPDQPYVLNYLGYSWVEKGLNLDKARRMLKRAVELRPNDGYIVDSLGWVLFRLGMFDESVGELERAVELEPQDPTINDHLGDVFWKVGRRNEARFQWRRALTLEPDPELVPKIEAKLERGLELSRADDSGS
ncbi:MAG: tetratricopeptide repeat protein [Alphaproteobacteria bacterium]